MIAPHISLQRPLVLHTRVVTGFGGGPEKTIFNSPRFLRPLGYDAACAYLHPPDDPGFAELQRKAAACAAELISVPDRGAWDWRVVTSLAELCRERRVAIWHGHDYKSNVLGLLVRRHWPMKLVSTVHGWVTRTWRTRLYERLDRWSLRAYDRVLCVSPDLFTQCLAAGVPLERCVLIENAIDLEHWQRRRSTADAKRTLGVSTDDILIGAVGRLSAEKGFDLLIRTVARLRDTGSRLTLHIAGEGNQRPTLERLIQELGCGDFVRLVGYLPDPHAFYEALDIFALSSLREGLPNVVLEAMAVGVPVVATRIAGIPQVLHDGVSGLIVEPGDVSALVAALGRLTSDVVCRNALAAAGRAVIEQRYSFDVRMRKVAAVYDAVLGHVPAPVSAPPVTRKLTAETVGV